MFWNYIILSCRKSIQVPFQTWMGWIIHDRSFNLNATIITNFIRNILLNLRFNQPTIRIESHVSRIRCWFIISNCKFFHQVHMWRCFIYTSFFYRFVLCKYLKLFMISEIEFFNLFHFAIRCHNIPIRFGLRFCF